MDLCWRGGLLSYPRALISYPRALISDAYVSCWSDDDAQRGYPGCRCLEYRRRARSAR